MVRRHEPHGDNLEEDAAVPDQVRNEEEHIILLLALCGLLVLLVGGHDRGGFDKLSLQEEEIQFNLVKFVTWDGRENFYLERASLTHCVSW